MSEGIVRQSVTMELCGKEYEFERPVIAMRRKFQKDCLRIAEIFSQMDFEEGAGWMEGDGARPLETPKNLRLFMDCADLILEVLFRYCPAMAKDKKSISLAFDEGTLTDSDISTEFGKIKGFVERPLSEAGESQDDTSESG